MTELPTKYWSEEYHGTHIALLWDRGVYSAYVNKELVPGWKITDIEKGKSMLRETVTKRNQTLLD